MPQSERASHEARVLQELRTMHDIARREHGPEARSTQRIREALKKVEQEHNKDRDRPRHTRER